MPLDILAMQVDWRIEQTKKREPNQSLKTSAKIMVPGVQRTGDTMSTKLVTILVILFGSTTFVSLSSADCRKAKHDEVPTGANMFVQMDTQTVPTIRGKVSFPDGGAAEHVVVEIFRYAGSDSYEDIKKALEQKRMKACVTREDGKFSFSGLKPGKYLLRAGIGPESPFNGMNEAHIILVLQPGGKETKAAGLDLKLTVGT